MWTCLDTKIKSVWPGMGFTVNPITVGLIVLISGGSTACGIDLCRFYQLALLIFKGIKKSLFRYTLSRIL